MMKLTGINFKKLRNEKNRPLYSVHNNLDRMLR